MADTRDELYQQAVATCRAPLERLARAYEQDPDKRRDLLQDIHVALWLSLEHYEGRCSLSTWVYRVAHNTAASALRKKSKAVGVDLQASPSRQADHPLVSGGDRRGGDRRDHWLLTGQRRHEDSSHQASPQPPVLRGAASWPLTTSGATCRHGGRTSRRLFQQKTRNRNLFLYASLAGLAVYFAGAILVLQPVMIISVALGLLVAGAIVVLAQLPKRLGTHSLPRELGVVPSVEFYRRELERERHARLNILSWYILPVVPGLSVLLVAFALTPGGRGILPAVILAMTFAAIFTFTVKRNQRAAHQLQQEIDELRAG